MEQILVEGQEGYKTVSLVMFVGIFFVFAALQL
jgi:hypothetical protein